QLQPHPPDAIVRCERRLGENARVDRLSAMNLKALVKSVPFLGECLREPYRKYYQWRYDPERLIERAFRGCENVQVVQIGSNDGLSNDPVHSLLLRNPSWQALLVE